MSHKLGLFFVCLIILGSVFSLTTVSQAAQLEGWAWSANVGWLEFPSVASGKSYGVTLNETTGVLTGDAWSQNIGWVNFTGVTLDSITKALTGSAQVRSVLSSVITQTGGWDGLIKMSPTDGNTGWGVRKVPNDSSGERLSGYAWGNNVVGWLNFDQVFVVGLAKPDLLPQNLSTSPTTPIAGTSMNLSGLIKNQGPAAAAASQARLRLDLNSPGTDGVYEFSTGLTDVAIGNLAANTGNQTATWSWTPTTAGTYGYQICADATNVIPNESNETNNCTTGTFTVAAAPLPTVSITATDASASETNLDPGTFTISRNGTVQTNLSVSFAVSGTAINGTDYNQITTPVSIPANATEVTVTVTPKADSSYTEGNELVTLTLIDTATYDVGAASAATVTIGDAVAPKPDYIVQNPTPSPSPTAGSPVTFFGTVKNQGTAAVSPSTISKTRLNFDLDRNGSYETWGGSATDVDTAGLAVNGTEDESLNWTPTTAGTYGYQICADATNVIPNESNEPNNCTTGTFTVAAAPLPTVSITATDASASETNLDPGTFTISRNGTVQTNLSVSFAVSGTAINGTDYNQITTPVSIPANATEVTVTVTPKADSSYTEGNELVTLTLTDTATYDVGAASAATVTIGDAVAFLEPNLVVTSFSVPNGVPNQVVAAKITVQNVGTGPTSSGGFYIGLHRGSPSVSEITCSHRTSQTGGAGALAAGTSATRYIYFYLPGAAGDYTAYALADSDCEITESDEHDNSLTANYSVGANLQPDYIAESLSVPGNLAAGQAATFSAAVRNLGTLSFLQTQTRLRLDLGNNGSYDLTLANQTTGGLLAGYFEDESWTGWTAVAGTHKFEVCADATGAINEANEDNNCATRVFTVPSIPPLPTISVNDVQVTEKDIGQIVDARVTVSLSSPSASSVTVKYSTINTASATGASFCNTGVDYLNNFLKSTTFSPGITRVTFSLPVCGDLVVEPTENFLVRLSQPTNATIADGDGEITIFDNDNPPERKSDYVVEGVTAIDGSGSQGIEINEPVTFSGSVKNQGSLAAAIASKTRLRLDLKNDGTYEK